MSACELNQTAKYVFVSVFDKKNRYPLVNVTCTYTSFTNKIRACTMSSFFDGIFLWTNAHLPSFSEKFWLNFVLPGEDSDIGFQLKQRFFKIYFETIWLYKIATNRPIASPKFFSVVRYKNKLQSFPPPRKYQLVAALLETKAHHRHLHPSETEPKSLYSISAVRAKHF